MKIGILTQPLKTNYGGLLQNYALQTILLELGHKPLTINVAPKRFEHPIMLIGSVLKRILLKLTGRDVLIKIWFNEKESDIISQFTQQFIIKNIKTTDLILKKVNKKLIEKYSFDAYIVGSDQVWRPRYSPQMSTYFLDFLANDTHSKKIAYAASFGVNDWEFSKSQTKKYKALLKQFDAVSVREDSAIDLCDKYFDMYVSHVLDPTMLLNKEKYVSLVSEVSKTNNKGGLFTYILDKCNDKSMLVQSVAQRSGLKVFSIMPKINYLEHGDIKDRIFPPVEEWLKAFMDASFIVTDSFHGTVFSILFNKPFITVVNRNRGITRITSLLKLFQLEERMVYSSTDFNPDLLKEIYWDRINLILKDERQRSIQFLKDHLKYT